MTDDLSAYIEGREHSGNDGISPNNVSSCYRQNAYRMFHVEPTNARPHGAADLGTLLHLGWAAMIGATYPPEIRAAEVELSIEELTRRGFADDVDFANRIVTDLKSAKDVIWQGWVNRGVPGDHWDQTEVYALALRRMYGGDWTMRIVALNRETGEREEFLQPADPEYALSLVRRAASREGTIRLGMAQDQTPEQFPREGRGPGRGYPCDYCDWLDRCWPPTGPDDPRSPQSTTLGDDATAIALALADYSEAAHQASKAKAAQGDARAFLTGIAAGSYGDFRLSWGGGRVRDPEPDCDEMMRLIPQLVAAIFEVVGTSCVSHAEPEMSCSVCEVLALVNTVTLPYPMKPGGLTATSIQVRRIPRSRSAAATVEVPLLAESGPGVEPSDEPTPGQPPDA